MEKQDIDILKDKVEAVNGVSVLRRYKRMSKLINGYSQHEPMTRALGFTEPYYGQLKLHNYRHLINFSDVENVVHWLFEQGFDVVRMIPKPAPSAEKEYQP